MKGERKRERKRDKGRKKEGEIKGERKSVDEPGASVNILGVVTAIILAAKMQIVQN